jgi:hypothetical protein
MEGTRVAVEGAMVFLVRALVLGLIVVGVRGASREAYARFDAAHGRADSECRAYRRAHPDADVCRDDPFARPVLPAFKEAQKKIDKAKAGRDPENELREAFDIATRLDAHGTFLGEIIAAKIVNDGIDVIERSSLPPLVRAEIVSHARLASAKHPFETERLERLWMLGNRDGLAGRGPIGAALVADAMLQEDAVLSEMDRAIAANDVPRCERAAHGRQSYLGAGDDLAFLCRKAAEVTRAQERSEKVIVAALLAGFPPPPVKDSDRPNLRLTW